MEQQGNERFALQPKGVTAVLQGKGNDAPQSHGSDGNKIADSQPGRYTRRNPFREYAAADWC